VNTPKRQQKSDNTRQRFINAIIEIIANGELENFTIRSLCTSLGLSPRPF